MLLLKLTRDAISNKTLLKNLKQRTFKTDLKCHRNAICNWVGDYWTKAIN